MIIEIETFGLGTHSMMKLCLILMIIIVVVAIKKNTETTIPGKELSMRLNANDHNLIQ